MGSFLLLLGDGQVDPSCGLEKLYSCVSWGTCPAAGAHITAELECAHTQPSGALLLQTFGTGLEQLCKSWFLFA